MENKTIYELNPSQEVVRLQCKYTLFKRVINILTSMTSDDELDFDVMEKALNLTVERNDCLRIKFCKHNKQLMQYFEDEVVFENIPRIEFKTKEEQDKFIKSKSKKAIKYKKGVILEPYFIKTYDNRYMVFFKLCHLILDIYGINMIFKDLFEVYDCLINNKELPPKPGKFEDVVKKDLEKKHDETVVEKNRQFFEDFLSKNEEPSYAGLSGANEPIWKKQTKKNRREMKMFFIKNDTKGYKHVISKDIVDGVMEYCAKNKYTPANFLFYTMSITAAKINGNIKNMIPLELCNCRGTMAEKKCAGTKVQSVACYTKIDHEKSFEENFKSFVESQMTMYRRIAFSDQEFEMMLHKTYNTSLLSTYYFITYSFIPYAKPKNLEFNIYSNGKCALPAYIAQLYDTNSGTIDMAYDCQTKIISETDIERFHKKYLQVIKTILQNPNIKVCDIKLEEN